MNINIPVSLGELVDKISILKIKSKKIEDKEKRRYVLRELLELVETLDQLNLNHIELHLKRLEEINSMLWDIEDQIRVKEKRNEFDEEFIDLARSVYQTNDERFKIKNEINHLYSSNIKEMKSYK